MRTSFSPTQQDVEHYRRLRAASMDLNHKILRTIPKRAYDDIGRAIGIARDGILVFDSEDMTGVFADCCIYEWLEDGKSVIQRYAETHPAQPGTDESFLLNACLHAEYGVLVTQSTVPGAGVHCRDLVSGWDLFVMDIGLSRGLHGRAPIATRIVPLGEYWMTGGAALPIHSRSAADACSEALNKPGRIALSIVRACLSTGAAEHIEYENVGSGAKGPRGAA